MKNEGWNTEARRHRGFKVIKIKSLCLCASVFSLYHLSPWISAIFREIRVIRA